MTRSVMLVLILGMMTGTSQAGIVEFYGEVGGKTALERFEAATDEYFMEPVIDFEGIAPEGGHTGTLSSYSENGVTFNASTWMVVIADSNSGVSGAPFQSDILYADGTGASLLAAVLPDGTGVVGAYFGELVETPHVPLGVTQIVLRDTLGAIILNKSYSIATMGSGGTFIGWVSGRDIGSIEHDVNSTAYSWSGLDDFRHGVIPEPGSVVMLISGCLCAVGLVWRRRQRQS